MRPCRPSTRWRSTRSPCTPPRVLPSPCFARSLLAWRGGSIGLPPSQVAPIIQSARLRPCSAPLDVVDVGGHVEVPARVEQGVHVAVPGVAHEIAAPSPARYPLGHDLEQPACAAGAIHGARVAPGLA